MRVSPTPWSATVAAAQIAGGCSVRPIQQTTNTARRMMSRRGTTASPTLGAMQGFVGGAGPLRSAARCARPRRAVVGAHLSAAARPTPVAGRMDSCCRCDNADGLMKPHPCVRTAASGVEAGMERRWDREGSGSAEGPAEGGSGSGSGQRTAGSGQRAAGGAAGSGSGQREGTCTTLSGRRRRRKKAKKWRWIQIGVVTTQSSPRGGGRGTGASNG